MKRIAWALAVALTAAGVSALGADLELGSDPCLAVTSEFEVPHPYLGAFPLTTRIRRLVHSSLAQMTGGVTPKSDAAGLMSIPIPRGTAWGNGEPLVARDFVVGWWFCRTFVPEKCEGIALVRAVPSDPTKLEVDAADPSWLKELYPLPSRIEVPGRWPTERTAYVQQSPYFRAPADAGLYSGRYRVEVFERGEVILLTSDQGPAKRLQVRFYGLPGQLEEQVARGKAAIVPWGQTPQWRLKNALPGDGTGYRVVHSPGEQVEVLSVPKALADPKLQVRLWDEGMAAAFNRDLCAGRCTVYHPSPTTLSREPLDPGRKVTLYVSWTNYRQQQLAEALVQQWQKMGIEGEIKLVAPDRLADLRRPPGVTLLTLPAGAIERSQGLIPLFSYPVLTVVRKDFWANYQWLRQQSLL